MAKTDDFELKCKKCKHEWIKRIKEPEQCPRCKTYKWKEIEEYEPY